jgi:hypothetical protein
VPLLVVPLLVVSLLLVVVVMLLMLRMLWVPGAAHVRITPRTALGRRRRHRSVRRTGAHRRRAGSMSAAAAEIGVRPPPAGRGGRLGPLAPAAAEHAAPAAADEGEEDQAADDAEDGDGDLLVVVDPVEDLLREVGALAVAVAALAAALARGAVEEVLVQHVALVGAELGRVARQHASVRRAGRGCVGAHEGPALLVARRAAARGALEAVAAGVAVGCVDIDGAGARPARAGLCRVAGPRAVAADGAVALEGALRGAAFFVGRVAHAARGVLARLRIAAGVAGAGCVSTTVTVLTALDDAVAALARKGCHALVVGQACCPAAEGTADVTDAAGRELGDAVARRGVHDELRSGITGVRRQRAAILFLETPVTA